MRPRELDEATHLAKRLGDEDLARILEGIQLPDGYEQETARQESLTAEKRARELLDDIRKRAERCFAGAEGEQAKQVVERWAQQNALTPETFAKQAKPAQLGRLNDVLSRLPRPRREAAERGRGGR